MNKICTNCDETKPKSSFYRDTSKKDHLASWCKKCSLIGQKTRRIQFKQQVINAYGNQCVCCRETRFEFLTFEHKNRDGAIHRKEIGGGTNMIRWIIKNNFPSSIEILCWNCNCAKGCFGYCPHSKLDNSI